MNTKLASKILVEVPDCEGIIVALAEGFCDLTDIDPDRFWRAMRELKRTTKHHGKRKAAPVERRRTKRD